MFKKTDYFPSLVCSQQFSLPWMSKIFAWADEFSRHPKVANPYKRLLGDKVMITFFFEPSTRTRISFEMAMLRLGGGVISTDNAGKFSSAVKGESLRDTMRVIADNEPDVVVLRHPKARSALLAAMVANPLGVPIINAGDGNNQHPTQALTDFYTIQKKVRYDSGRPLRIAMVGDLENGRTVRSLCYLLAKFHEVEIHFVSPRKAAMREDIKEYLRQRNVTFFEGDELRKVAPLVDVLYQTRVQKERKTDTTDFDSGKFTVTEDIAKSMNKDAIIMHPLPRVKEITKKVDKDVRACYFEQAKYGKFIRMALLTDMLAPDAKMIRPAA